MQIKNPSDLIKKREYLLSFLIFVSLIVVVILSLLNITGLFFNTTIPDISNKVWQPMKIVSGVSFMLTVITILIIRFRTKNIYLRIVSYVLTLCIFFVALITLLSYLFVYINGHDSSLVNADYLKLILAPERRMELLSAVNFLLTGIILILLNSEKPQNSGLAHLLIFPVFLLSYYTILGFVYGVFTTVILNGITVSLITGIAFLGIVAAVLMIRPDTWLLRLYSNFDMGGYIGRRLIPAALIVPVVIGWVRIYGERTGLFASSQGVILVSLFYTIGLILLVSLTTLYVRRIDNKRSISEEALKLSEKRYRELAENIPDIITRLDTDLRIIYGNKAVTKRTGKPVDHFTGKRASDTNLDRSAAERFEDTVREVLRTGEQRRIEYSSGWQDETRIFDIVITPERDENENVRSVISIARDITLQKEVEEALRMSEEQFRLLVKYAPTAIYEMNIKGTRFLSVNDTMCEILGYSRDELLHIQPFKLLEIDSRASFAERIRKKLGGEKIEEEIEYRIRKKNGDIIYALINLGKITFADDTDPRVTVIAYDITARKKMEKELFDSEKRFRELVKNAPSAIYEIDFIRKKLHMVNDAMCRLSGYSREELLSMDITSLLTVESRKNFLTRISHCMKGEVPEDHIEYKVIKKNGEIITAVLDMKFNFDEHGIPVGAVVIGHDITERKRIQEALYRSEQRLKYHLENSPLAVIEWDKDFNIIQWSDEAERIFGLKRENVLGCRIDTLNLIFEEDIPIVEKTMKRLTSGKELKVVSQNRNYNEKRQVIDCIWYNSVLLDDKGKMNSVMSLVENVTALKKFEKELVTSNERYEELLTNAQSIILKLDKEGKFTYINEFGLRFFGYSEDELHGRSVNETIVPKYESSGRHLQEIVEKIYKEPDKDYVNINENIKKNGERAWIEWHNKAITDRSTNLSGLIAIGHDITQRKKAEQALKDSEDKLWSVLNATQESIYMFDRRGIITMSNSTGIKRLGRRVPREVVGHHFSEFMSPQVAKLRQSKFDIAFKTGKPLKFEDERDGRFFSHNFFPVQKDDHVSFIVTYSTDITKRKTDEANLKESEDRFRTIAESLPVLISIYNITDSGLSFMNEAYSKAFGLQKEELVKRSLTDFFASSKDLEEIGNELKMKGEIFNKEVRVKREDGSYFWIMTSIKMILFMNAPAYLTASIDITETKNAQEELMRLNRTLHAQSKSSQAMMHMKDEISYLNEVCKIIIEDCGHKMVWVGYVQNDEQKSVKPVAHYGFDSGYIDQMKITWDDTERGNGPTGRSIKTGKPILCKNMLTDPSFEPWRESAISRGYASSLSIPIKVEGKVSGSISIYSTEPDPFSEHEIEMLLNLVNDLGYGISYLRLAESDRLATMTIKENELLLKELIATKDKFFNIVAHDLKNPFTSLLGSSELLFENITELDNTSIRELALILNDSAKSGYAILQNLLDWSRSQTGMLRIKKEKINLRTLVNENLDALQLAVSKKEIRMKNNISEGIQINSDRNMISTIMRNLLSNSVKFSYKSGEVVISSFLKNNQITIGVKDSGVGIPADLIEKLFSLETNYSMTGTAKEQGTGLGLKLSREFADKLGGNIWVESIEGKGSEFKFKIPVQ